MCVCLLSVNIFFFFSEFNFLENQNTLVVPCINSLSFFSLRLDDRMKQKGDFFFVRGKKKIIVNWGMGGMSLPRCIEQKGGGVFFSK